MSFPAAAEHARSESRSSRASQLAPGEQAGVVHSTLRALEQDLNRTTEVIRRHQQQQMMDKRTFQGEMEVSGRIEVEPQEKWLNLHLRSVSTEDLKKELAHVKEDQRQNAYQDTLAALVYDVNATAEVLRRGSLKRKKPKSHEEVEYRLRLTPAPDEEELYHREEAPPPMEPEEDYTVEHVKKDYDVDLLDESQISSLKRRARSATPRRTLNIEPAGPIGPIPVCAYCQEEIDGPVLTALAPNAEKAQKFHPYHFMCCYCQKALNLHGTFREHERRPYCHDCFYKLWNGLVYEPDINQRKIEKLI